MPETAVLLFNLGGPETLRDVRPFLLNLFSDPGIIRIKNDFFRISLAWFIASMRQSRSCRMYKAIGGGSPLRGITEAQAAALALALEDKGLKIRAYVGMLCWKPSIEEAVQEILCDRIDRLVLLPLFPQYSSTTTESCLSRFWALDRKFYLSTRMDIRIIKEWYDEPLYIEALTDLIRESAQAFCHFEGDRIKLLYSAHSIPMRYVRTGDPYLEQVLRTVELLETKLKGDFESYLAFQSKVGPVRWLRPSIKEVLQKLGRAGCPRVLLVPISFVSDQLETLYEIDIECKQIAIRSGIKEFQRIPALNLHPKFIEALANRVMREIC